jgi:predicted kinase
MTEIIMTKGLPGSGKSTWAEDYVASWPQGRVRITKDQLRTMLHAGSVGKGTEKVVLAARDAMVVEFLTRKLTVVVDDTNLAPFHEARLGQLARENGAKFSVKDFTDFPIEQCIERDRKRPHPVGEKVIRQMWRQYLRPAPEVIEHVPGLPSAVIVDIDGTIARMVERGPFEWAKVGSDEPVPTVVRLVRDLSIGGERIVFMSGRDEVCRPETEEWLIRQGLGVGWSLFMRPAGDMRKDSLVKRELFDAHVRGNFNVRFVLDDRNQVVDMWRNDLGLTCLQVAEGDF